MDYYQNTTHISCSDLKAAMRKHLGTPEPNFTHMPSIQFGRDVDEYLTDFRQDKVYGKDVIDAAEMYKAQTKTPFFLGGKKCQWELYKTLNLDGKNRKFRGKLDIWYPRFSIFEDIKTTSMRYSATAVENFIDFFDYDMQLYLYMQLTGSKTGIISIISKRKWMHQVHINKESKHYALGRKKLIRHLEIWDECGR